MKKNLNNLYKWMSYEIDQLEFKNVYKRFSHSLFEDK